MTIDEYLEEKYHLEAQDARREREWMIEISQGNRFSQFTVKARTQDEAREKAQEIIDEDMMFDDEPIEIDNIFDMKEE